MKFKVGDKVKVIKCDISGTNCSKLNKIFLITDIIDKANYPYKLKGIGETFSDDELELIERQFTKADLKDGDIATDREGEKRTVSKGFLVDNFGAISLTYFTEDLKDADGLQENDIVKVERPVKYETVFEREEILDETEKKYLARVIKPFRYKVKSIMKRIEYSSQCYIKICLKNDDAACLPSFKENSMYKGMELNREYSLKELGLEWTVAKNNFKGENYEC